MSILPGQLKRGLLLVSGCLSLALGIIGIFLPLLPTTPFLLLSALCFAKGSPRLHAWLLNHPRLGPPINNWQTHGAISRRAKWLASLSLLLLLGISALLQVPLWVIGLQLVVLSAVSVFLWSRPDPPVDIGSAGG